MTPHAATSDLLHVEPHAERRAFVRASSAEILVVDRDECMRELLRIHLSNAGYGVILAEDAVAGLKCLLRCAPRLIILDVDLPYMDGLEFVRTLKADPALSPVPVMFLTARENVDEAARKLGALACMRKPVLASELVSAVAAALAGDKWVA